MLQEILNKRFLSEEDLDYLIYFLNNNKKYIDNLYDKYNELYKDKKDLGSISHVLNSGFAEDFYRYDSEVSEKFIIICKEILKGVKE